MESAIQYRICLIGAGNLAWNLAMALRGTPWQPIQVISRDENHAESIATECGIAHFAVDPTALLKDLDLVIVCSNDHMIEEIAATYAGLKGEKTVFVHTAGSISMSALGALGEDVGVLYPLQTFTRGHLPDFRKVPFFLEGNEKVLSVIEPLARHLSDEVRYLDSAGRLQLHLGAVFASNFANFMWILAEDSLVGLEGLDLRIFGPLVQECASKAFQYGPTAAQTGPAKRGDLVTMEKHLALLAQQDTAREKLYRLLSTMIQDRFRP